MALYSTSCKTPEDAMSDWHCPVGRVFGGDVQAKCRGDACPLWRWKPLLATDPRFTSAINREILALSKERPKVSRDLLHKEAVAKVHENPRDYMIPEGPEVGYCGLGGRVLA